MYRKYQSSTKSSRHERLAQLSEQESVIEKKKREILAKLEAQKRKETEAFRKLEPSNIGFIVGKNDNTRNFMKESDTWEKDFEEGEPKVACHRNAFSNDGSFLDHFKKISSSLSQKTVNLLTLPEVTKREEALDCNKTLEKDCKKNKGICDSFKRNIYDVDIDMENPDKKIQNSNVQNQLISSVPGWVQLIHSHNQIPLPHCSKLNDEVLNSTTTVAQSKAVSSQIMAKAQNDNMCTNEMRDVSLSPLWIPIMPVKRNIPSPNLHSLTDGSSFQMQAITTKNTNQPDLRRDQRTDKEVSAINIAENTFIDGAKKRRKSKYEEPCTQVHSDQMSRCSPMSDETSRVSPALIDDEEEDRNEELLRDAVGQEGRRTHSSLQSTNSCWSSSDEGEREWMNTKSKGTTEKIDFEEQANRRKGKEKGLECDSTDSDSHSKDSNHSPTKPLPDHEEGTNKNVATGDSYKTDCDDESIYAKTCYQTNQKLIIQESLKKPMFSSCNQDEENPGGCGNLTGKDSSLGERRKRKKKSRWGDEVIQGNLANTTATSNIPTVCSGTGVKAPMLSRLTRSDPGLIQYARQTFGSTNLSEDDWKKAEDHYKINLLYQDMVKKRAEIDRLEKAGKFKYEYDSDEDVEGGTWEHKLRQQEMMATQLWAEELTRQAAGKHHIGDFLPPEELERFMEKYNAVKQGRNPDLSDYKEFKLKEDNVGYRLLQKMGWNEGQGLGQSGTGIKNPVNKASTRHENQGLGVDRPDGLQAGDDEYDAYRKRMMLAYRFRPNPLNNPRRPYY